MLKKSNNLAENLFIITAPSGTGKTTLIKNVIEFAKTNDEKVFMSVSHTTRTPRSNELDGLDYFFSDINKYFKNPKYIANLECPLTNNNFINNVFQLKNKNHLKGLINIRIKLIKIL